MAVILLRNRLSEWGPVLEKGHNRVGLHSQPGYLE